MKNNTGVSVLEILVVASILILLALIIYPALTGIKRDPPRIFSEALLANLNAVLEVYASDYNGNYPPDTLESNPKRLDKLPLLNTSQCLAYFLESEFIVPEFGKSGRYILFTRRNKLNKNEADLFKEVTIKDSDQKSVRLMLSVDFIVDQVETPVFYDERKSEGDKDGMNPNTFILISGGDRDENENVDLSDLDSGDLSMFKKKNLKKIDTIRSQYRKEIPTYFSNEVEIGDDIIEPMDK